METGLPRLSNGVARMMSCIEGCSIRDYRGIEWYGGDGVWATPGWREGSSVVHRFVGLWLRGTRGGGGGKVRCRGGM
jgi:hypothetical protein